MPTSLWCMRGEPTSAPPPVTMFTTPLGSPASSRALSRFTTERGVSVAGLITTVLPRMSAGIIFQEGMAMGKFQGVMRPAMPTGWRTDIWNLLTASPRAWSGRTGAGPRPPCSTSCRWLPGRRRGSRPGPCPSPASCPARTPPCAAPGSRPRGRGSRPAWGRAGPSTSGTAARAAATAFSTSSGAGVGEGPDELGRVRGVAVLERLARGRGHPLPGDVVAERERERSGRGHGYLPLLSAARHVAVAPEGRRPRRSRPAARGCCRGACPRPGSPPGGWPGSRPRARRSPPRTGPGPWPSPRRPGPRAGPS